MKVVQSLALTSMIGLGSLYGADYKVDTSHSDIGFKVKHMMISNVKGNFEKFSGSFSLDEKTKIFSKIEGSVEVATLTTQNEKRDGHLKSPDFFDVAKYPQMKFKLLEHRGDSVRVELSIKDVTKVVTMEVEDISGIVKDPWGNTRVAFEIKGEINRKEFHMNFSQLLETGGLLVDDRVKFDIVIEGIEVK